MTQILTWEWHEDKSLWLSFLEAHISLFSTQSPGQDTMHLIIFLSWHEDIYFFSSTHTLIIELKLDLCGFSVRPFHLYECRDFCPTLLGWLEVDHQNQQMPSGTAIIQAARCNSDFQFFFFNPSDISLTYELTCAFKIIIAIQSRSCKCFKLFYGVILHFLIFWSVCLISAPVSL